MAIRIYTKVGFFDNVRNILKTNLNLAGCFDIYSNVPALNESSKYGSNAD